MFGSSLTRKSGPGAPRSAAWNHGRSEKRWPRYYGRSGTERRQTPSAEMSSTAVL